MTEEQLADHILIGRIGAVYGIKGWVKLISFANPQENILAYRKFILLDGGQSDTLEIDQSKPQGKGFVAHIRGCDDREQARLYTGKGLYIEKALLPELQAGEYYWHQLTGLRVITSSGDDLGNVDHLLETGANDVLVVRGDTRSIDREERLIPYLYGQVVEEVDLDQEVIRVNWDKDY
ncbi:MAG: ribosome maturation factor RimM [Gammaproteobacteria bacterium]|nr:ribosome maturation factor RimM [Gammaproteobacteria bacterium]MAY03962.1 ribosome maturation factor RimM [Gammaproteobacteria bacterium]|tara:strand:- start:201 stop:734 length:534 start_codon:yes stop_codon:yes gene_type:complete